MGDEETCIYLAMSALRVVSLLPPGLTPTRLSVVTVVTVPSPPHHLLPPHSRARARHLLHGVEEGRGGHVRLAVARPPDPLRAHVIEHKILAGLRVRARPRNLSPPSLVVVEVEKGGAGAPAGRRVHPVREAGGDLRLDESAQVAHPLVAVPPDVVVGEAVEAEDMCARVCVCVCRGGGVLEGKTPRMALEHDLSIPIHH